MATLLPHDEKARKVHAGYFLLLLFTVLEAKYAGLSWLCVTSPHKKTTRPVATLT